MLTIGVRQTEQDSKLTPKTMQVKWHVRKF